MLFRPEDMPSVLDTVLTKKYADWLVDAGQTNDGHSWNIPPQILLEEHQERMNQLGAHVEPFLNAAREARRAYLELSGIDRYDADQDWRMMKAVKRIPGATVQRQLAWYEVASNPEKHVEWPPKCPALNFLETNGDIRIRTQSVHFSFPDTESVPVWGRWVSPPSNVVCEATKVVKYGGGYMHCDVCHLATSWDLLRKPYE